MKGKSHARSTKGFSQAATEKESMRQFNYYGKTRLENLDEHDIVGLEREIDFIIRNSHLGNSPTRGGTAANGGDYIEHIVDVNGEVVTGPQGLPRKRNKTAGHHNPRAAKKKLLKDRQKNTATQNPGFTISEDF